MLHYNLNVLSLPFQLHVPHFSTIEGRELKSRLGSSARFVKATVWNRIVGQRYAAYFLLTCDSICFAEKKKGFLPITVLNSASLRGLNNRNHRGASHDGGGVEVLFRSSTQKKNPLKH